VRRNWFAAWTAACFAAGCAGSNTTPPGGMHVANNGAPGAFAQAPVVQPPTTQPPIQQVSWTDKILAPFGGGPPTAAEAHREAMEQAQAAEARRQQFDPIALSRNAGPPTPALFVSLADVHARNGHVVQARQLYQKALAAEPQNLQALLGAARMEDREGNLDVATMLYRRAAAAYPNNPTVLNDLGLCLARQAQLEEAEKALLRAVQLEPAKALYRNNMAKIQVEMDRLDAAVQHLAAVYPPPVVNYNMGVLLHERGRSDQAESFLATAVRLDPNLQPAHILLAEIRPSSPLFETARAPQAPAPAATPATPTETPSTTTPNGETADASDDPQPDFIDTGAPPMPSTMEPVLLPPVS
jgi:Tfp pilus assembly protein PilF